MQQVGADEFLHLDKDSFEAGPEHGEAVPEPEKPAPVSSTTPKLRPGEKGTGSLLQDDEPFNLAGERGTDSERVAAEKSKADAAKQADAEFQAKAHGDLFQSEKQGGISDKANALAQKLESLKTGITKGGQLHAFGVPALIWDKAVELAQAVIRKGGSIADAITEAIAHIKANHKGDFEEDKARFALLGKAQGEEQSKAGEAPPTASASLTEVKADFADAEANLKKVTAAAPKTFGSAKGISAEKCRGRRSLPFGAG